MVAAVRHDPALRLELAGRFYDDRPGRPSIRAYRRAELAFMRWQASRGALAPPESTRPGSAWWRSVNESLLRDACEAGRLAAGRPGQPSRPAVARWAGFLSAPSPGTWYQAHNASIVAAYLEHRHLCEPEVPAERFFMDVAMARDLDEPRLLGFVRNGFPVYAWPYEDRDAWTTTRARSVRSVLSWLTSA